MLCNKCEGKNYARSFAECRICRKETGSYAFDLCRRCAIANNECVCCGDPIDPEKPQPQRKKPKPPFLVVVNTPHYCGKQRARTHEGILRRNQRAIRALKKNVASLVRERTLPADAVKFENVLLSNKSETIVTCTHEVADVLMTLPGVDSAWVMSD